MRDRRFLHSLVGLYPRRWRVRYGDEFEALIDDLVDARGLVPAVAFGILWGALKEWVRPEVRPDISATAGSDAYRLAVALREDAWRRSLALRDAELRRVRLRDMWTHRDALFRRRLGKRVAQWIEPGEVVLGAFDVCTGSPRVANARTRGLSCFGIWLGPTLFADAFISLTTGDWSIWMLHPWLPWIPWFAPGALIYILGMLGGLCTRTRRSVLVLTTLGWLDLSVDWLNRPRKPAGRLPAAYPVVLQSKRCALKVSISGRTLWVLGRPKMFLASAGAVA